MIKPPLLQSGDKIGILSTARKIVQEEIAPAISLFESWDLKVQLGKTIGAEHHQYAGTDEQRLADLQGMLDDKEIKAIICARGGYGTVRLIDQLNLDIFEEYPKWIVGYSDITALHAHIYENLEIETIHGPMPLNYPGERKNGIPLPTYYNTPASLEKLKEALFTGRVNYEIPTHSLNKNGKAMGLLKGGNLSVLYNLAGTNSDISNDFTILFIEDLDEYLYHIDRMMMNLRRTGKLEKISGLIVGGLTDMHDNDIPFGQTAEEIIASHMTEMEIPICFGFPAGHIEENMPLILGDEVELTVTDSGCTLRHC